MVIDGNNAAIVKDISRSLRNNLGVFGVFMPFIMDIKL
jgi:hypothetical protein